MPRTAYGKKSEISIPGGPSETAQFKFERNSPTAPVPTSRRITIPPHSAWSTGLHWHEEYVEHVQVLQGRASLTIAGTTRTYGPEDGILTFPKYVIHGFGRADRGQSADDAEDTVLEEWVDPEDGFKMVFFYNVIGALRDANGKPGPSDIVQLGTMLAHVDEYPVIVPGPFALKYVAIHAALGTISWIGWALGYKPWLKVYTPEALWDVARLRGLPTRKDE